MLVVDVYKEKKKEEFRLIVLPTGKNKMGLTQIKDYGIITYLNKDNVEKIGEFVLWALEQSDNEVIESKSIVEFSKKYFNLNSNRKIATNYNLVGLKFLDEKSIIRLQNKDGYGFSPFEDENGNNIEFEFKERPTALELGLKVMEMFEYKEKYDGLE
mgnify:CR=1 FL=1